MCLHFTDGHFYQTNTVIPKVFLARSLSTLKPKYIYYFMSVYNLHAHMVLCNHPRRKLRRKIQQQQQGRHRIGTHRGDVMCKRKMESCILVAIVSIFVLEVKSQADETK